MMKDKPKAVAWDEWFWVDGVMSGSAGYVSSEKPADLPVLLVPDGKGDYREHVVTAKPKGRIGF